LILEKTELSLILYYHFPTFKNTAMKKTVLFILLAFLFQEATAQHFQFVLKPVTNINTLTGRYFTLVQTPTH